MPLPKTKAVVKSNNMDVATTTFRVKDINLCKDTETVKWGDKDLIIEYPYTLTIIEAVTKAVALDERSTGSMNVKKWTKKFYSNIEYNIVNFTRENSLLALMMVLRGSKHAISIMEAEAGEINLNDLIGVEFEGVMAGNPEIGQWINWAETMRMNNIYIPTIEEVEMKIETNPYEILEKSLQKEQAPADAPTQSTPKKAVEVNSKDHLNDLPY